MTYYKAVIGDKIFELDIYENKDKIFLESKKIKSVLSNKCKILKRIHNEHSFIEPTYKDIVIDLYKEEHLIWSITIKKTEMFKKYMENSPNKLLQVKETSSDSSMSFTVLLNLKTHIYTYDELPISNISFVLKI